jgi:hypothetical protein
MTSEQRLDLLERMAEFLASPVFGEGRVNSNRRLRFFWMVRKGMPSSSQSWKNP